MGGSALGSSVCVNAAFNSLVKWVSGLCVASVRSLQWRRAQVYLQVLPQCRRAKSQYHRYSHYHPWTHFLPRVLQPLCKGLRVIVNSSKTMVC